MGVKNLVFYPAKILKQETQNVEDVTSLKPLIQDLKDSVEYYNGVGLAAPQIGGRSQVFVINHDILDNDRQGIQVFINPQIVSKSKVKETFQEACLSLPGVEVDVKRPSFITLEALDEEGVSFSYEAYGFEASALQHEYDHLQGICLPERVSTLKRRIMLRKYKKFMRRMNALQKQLKDK